MTHNGVELQSMTFNDQEVVTWIHNGFKVFGISQPFYWVKDSIVQDGYPISYNTYSSENVNYIRNSLSSLYLGTTSMTTSVRYIGYTEAVYTKGNKYMEIDVYMAGNGNTYPPMSLTFNDKDGNGDISTKITASGTYVIDISHVNTITIWADSMSWPESASELRIQSLRFYS